MNKHLIPDNARAVRSRGQVAENHRVARSATSTSMTSSSRQAVGLAASSSLSDDVCQSTDELRAEVQRLKDRNLELERRVAASVSPSRVAASVSPSALKKSSTTHRNEATTTKHQQEKIDRLELQLFEAQRRSSETQTAIEAKLKRALDANRTLRFEHSRQIHEMQAEIEDLRADVEIEELCAAAMTTLHEDVHSSGRNDHMSSLKSKYERELREKDDTITDLEAACERKDRVVAALSAEVKGAREDACRLKTSEATRLPHPPPQQKQLDCSGGDKTSAKVSESAGRVPMPTPAKALRRNSANATCA